MSTHHTVDTILAADKPLFVNEPQLADQTVLNLEHICEAEDNVRIYVPLDLNREALLRRLYDIYARTMAV